MRLLGLVLVMLCVLTAAAVSAEEPAKKPAAAEPVKASMEATLGEYANGLWAQRNALEQELAQARATIKALTKQIEELTKKVGEAPAK